jgi:hypothetical protein
VVFSGESRSVLADHVKRRMGVRMRSMVVPRRRCHRGRQVFWWWG